MLLVKLKTPVEKIYQGEGLSTITVTAEYLSSQVENYTMGQLKTQFYYKIGKVTFKDGKPLKFDPVIKGYITVSVEDLEEWGTDDFIALQAVAKNLNIEIEDTPILLEKGLFKS
jgi:uncharacterized GH25 family protein